MTKIKNPIARIWTRSELKQTVKQAKEQGYRVQKGEMTEIFHNDKCVLRSLTSGTKEIVRMDKTFFC